MESSDICRKLSLPLEKCELLQDYLSNHCGFKASKAPTGRKRSKWQECIATRRAGKKFDPEAIRELAKEYKAGRCP